MKYKLLRFSLMCILAMLGGVVHADYYQKVTSATDITNGDYLIVYEEGSVAFNGGLTTLDAVSNTVAVTIESNKIASSATVDAATFTIASTDDGYTVRSASGNYIGQTSYANGLKQATALATGYYHAISIDGDNAVFKITTSGGDVTLRYNKASDQNRFRFFKSGQQAIQLYKKVTESSDNRIATILTLGDHQVMGEVGSSMNLPTTTVMAGETEVTGATITWESSNTDVATIADGKISLLAAGTTTITATYGGDTTYKGSSEKYTLTVTKAPYTSIAGMLDDITSTKTNIAYRFENLLVTYVNGSYTYVSDGTDGFLFYGSSLGLSAGDRISGTANGQLYTYNGLPELAVNTTGLSVTKNSEGNEVAYTTITPADLQNYINKLIVIENAVFVAAGTGKNLTFKVGDAEFTVYNNWSIDVSSLMADKVYTLKGIGSVFNTTNQLYLVSFEEKAEESFTYRDFAVPLSDGTFDSSTLNFGVKVAEDGTYTATTADDATANFTVSAVRWNDAQHGWVNCTFTVPVEGAVKIELGDCQYGGQNGTITDAGGNSTDIKANATKACWSSSAPHGNVVVTYYAGTEPTTLTIAYNGYCPFIAVTSIDPSEIPNEATLTFDAAEASAEGTAPAAQKVEIGQTVTIPANTTLYKDGFTLTAWTDGTNQYKAGDVVTVSADITLTPVFTENTVAFADRTAETTITWLFGEGNGVGTLNAQGKSAILVAQATIGESIIDVKMEIDATSGKINNVGRGDKWAQCNDGTVLTIPAYKGTAVSFDSNSSGEGTTIGGVEATGKVATYNGTDETLDIVAKGIGHIASVTAVYPVPEQETGEDDTNILYSWESPEGTVQEVGGTIAYVNGDGDRLNYKNGDYYTICLNGKKANINDATASANAGKMVITLDKALKAGDEISMTAYINKNTSTSASAYVLFGNGTGIDGEVYSDDANIGLATPGAPKTTIITVPEAAEGSKTITLTRSTTGTNLFITKLVITGEEREEGGDDPVVEYPILYTWDFTDANSACTLEGGGQGATYSYPSDKDANVTLEVDATNGKFNPRGTDVQVNATTIINVPVQAEGDVITIYNYRDGSNGVTYTIGTEEKTASNVTYEYTVSKMEAKAGFVTITVTGNGYMDKFTVLQNEPESEGYNNADFAIEWPMVVEGKADLTAYTAEPAAAVSVASFDYTPSDATVNIEARSKDPDNGMTFVTFKGANFKAHWFVKPTAGLTFTPTQIKLFVQRFGTNKKDGVVVTAKVGDEGNVQTLGTYTARRANWDDGQEATQWGSALSNLVNEVVINLTEAQQAALSSGEGLHLYATTGLDASKSGGFADCRIYGKVNGTAATVSKYTLATAVAPAEGGSVSAYPAADEYEEGTEVTLTATENFGYDFVNWTNAVGEEVSTEAKFKYIVNADETLTANFQAVETYELALTVDGTNDYMVTIDPAPTMVDGKMMYEAGTAVQLTANSYEGLVTFNNWSDGETSSSKLISMTDDTEVTAVYANAVDIIAGWDFYKSGNQGRIADFASEMNQTSALSLVNTDTGETSGWLDKSTEAANGYESFKGAAVNWRQGTGNGDVGHYHWQTKVNAGDFTDINVQFQMLYNYNAYKTYNVEYSLNGEEWTGLGSITMTGAKAPASFNGVLPDDCNNQAEVYIRMIADKTSSVDGTASANDGNALAMFFITGKQALVDDGQAPVLVSTVPADGATGVSASGKVVLTFDEKVMVSSDAAATLGSLTLTPVVSGKTISFEYKGLEYSTEYTFTLPIYTVSDLTNNAIDVPITFSFTTMTRPTVTKGLYDAVVEDADQLLAAINEANSRSDKNTRYRIFLKNGTYTLPLSTTASINSDDGNTYPAPYTVISGSNISFIGESTDGVVITNSIDNTKEFAGQFGTTNVYDGIGKSDVLQLQGSVRGTYFQDLTVRSGMNDARGRNIAVQDKGSQTIYKNTVLWGYQDTWTSNNDNGLYYFEGGKVRGRTDFLCGKGDAFFNAVDIQVCMNTGGYIAVPSKSIKYGYVFKGCNILCESSSLNGKYTLGRPWGEGTPVALWIDTKMQYAPSAIGWSEMSNGWPKQFAEWNSTLTNGTPVDLSGRKTIFAETHENNPVMTAEQALEAGDPHNMFGDWDPTLLTEQAPVPQNVKQEGNNLVWDSSDYALLWAIVKDGSVVDFTTEPTYELTESGTYAVRAANEMGGLSEASESVEATVAEVVKVTLNASGYATLASAKALDFSGVDGLTAYIVKEQTAEQAVLTSVNVTPAGTGLVLIGSASADYSIPVATTEPAAIEGNLLVAAVEETTVGAETVYVLTGNKFMLFAGTVIPAGKAYLEKTTQTRSLELVFDDATGINATLKDNDTVIYDLQGRRVAQPRKGLYLMNGKKVIIK